ncbi:hypothetical protein F5X96DRAFT_301741 [Biscogniauxia mediterranea]|nr:hypothetical protein F5X96DRAFT_301741 [Biscogniauxia mediterranea]
MPSVTHSESATLSSTSKKRRRDNDDEVQMSFPTSQLNNESHNFLSTINNNERLTSPSPFHNIPRKVVPLPVNKRFRSLNEDEQASSPTTQPRHDHHTYNQHDHHHHQQSYFSHAHPTPPLSPQVHEPPHGRPSITSRTNSAQSLSPCHICHRKPTKKSDLDSFADCMGCGRRTCFVCIRACPGWLPTGAQSTALGGDANNGQSTTTGESDDEHSTSFVMRDVDDVCTDDRDISHTSHAPEPTRGKPSAGGDGWSGRGHREVICSGCCVERGSEGDVVCLGCLSGLEGA